MANNNWEQDVHSLTLMRSSWRIKS